LQHAGTRRILVSLFTTFVTLQDLDGYDRRLVIRENLP